MPKFNILTEQYSHHFRYVKEWFTLELHEDFIVMKRNDQYFYVEKSSGFDPFADVITDEYLKQFEFKEFLNAENDYYIKLLKPLVGKINTLRKQYRISNALGGTIEEPYFTNHKDAWNYLRQIFSESRFMTLWEKQTFFLPINNPIEYCEAYNKKYGPRHIGYGPDNAKLLDSANPLDETEVWIPVLSGLTGHEYNVKTLKD